MVFSLHQIGSGTHQGFFPKDIGYTSMEINQPEHEVDYSATLSVDVKNACVCTSFFLKCS
jgi:hypothetical protein